MLFKGVGKSGRDEIKCTEVQMGTKNDTCPTSASPVSEFHTFLLEMRTMVSKREGPCTVAVVQKYYLDFFLSTQRLVQTIYFYY